MPVTVNSARTPVRSDHWSTVFCSASGSPSYARRRRGEVLHRAAGLAQAVPGEVGRRGSTCSWAVAGSGVALGDDLELGDDAGQALGDGVVDLGGQPAPLVGDARFPCLDEELGVQGGVLLVGLLELG